MREVNVTSLMCPLPILKLSQALAQMQSGEKVKLIADDPATKNDIPSFLRMSGHHLVLQEEVTPQFIFVIEKK